MKSKITPLVFLVFLSCLISQKSNSQTFTSVRYNADSLLFDGSSVNRNYKSGCAGTISMLKGCAKIIKPGGECGTPGSSSSASVGGSVEQGDRIVICDKSIIEVTLPDGSVMRGGPGSEINIDEAACDEQSRNFSFRLLMGSVWSQVMPYMGGESNYVSTENAVTGVRGTKYFVKIARDTVFDNPERSVFNVNVTTTVVCIEGIVDVSNTNGITVVDTATQVRLYEDFNNKRITLEEFQRRVTEMNNNNKVGLTAGMETVVTGGNPPTPPRKTRMTEADFSNENMLNR